MAKLIFTFALMLVHLVVFCQNPNAELIVSKTDVWVKDGKLVKDYLFEIKINNRAGEIYTNISLPYSKLCRIGKIEAAIKDSRGKIVKMISKKDIVERSYISDYSFYEDDFLKEFSLKHNSYPYSILYSYQYVQDEFLSIVDWSPVIESSIPTRKAILTLTVPVNYPILLYSQYIDKPEIDTTGTNIEYKWSAKSTVVDSKQILSPPLRQMISFLSVVPENFRYDKEGSFKSWIQFGNWYCELLRGKDELPEKEKNIIGALIIGAKDDKEKIKRLYHYLQDETRYVNISVETGGLKPYPASYVADNKYGDCKALTNYFRALLKFSGINSYYALINAGSPKRQVNKGFPSQQFNHAILYIPAVDGGDMWLDCTSKGPFNYIGTFIQDRDALIIDANNSRFIRTPALKPDNVAEIRKIIVPNKMSQRTNLITHSEYRGETFEEISYIQKYYTETDQQKILKTLTNIGGAEIRNINIGDRHRDSQNIMLESEMSVVNPYAQYGNDIFVSNFPFILPDFEKVSDREMPLQIDCPIYKIDTLVYKIPIGYRIKKISPDINITGEYGYFTQTILQEGTSIRLIKKMLINAGEYQLEKYGDFIDFVRKIEALEKEVHIILTR